MNAEEYPSHFPGHLIEAFLYPLRLLSPPLLVIQLSL